MCDVGGYEMFSELLGGYIQSWKFLKSNLLLTFSGLYLWNFKLTRVFIYYRKEML